MQQKFRINCEYGSDNPEKATIAFTLAFTSSKTSPTAVFVTFDATYLMLQTNRPQIVADGYEPLNDLIDGVELAGAPKTMAYLAEGAMTLA